MSNGGTMTRGERIAMVRELYSQYLEGQMEFVDLMARLGWGGTNLMDQHFDAVRESEHTAFELAMAREGLADVKFD